MAWMRVCHAGHRDWKVWPVGRWTGTACSSWQTQWYYRRRFPPVTLSAKIHNKRYYNRLHVADITQKLALGDLHNSQSLKKIGRSLTTGGLSALRLFYSGLIVMVAWKERHPMTEQQFLHTELPSVTLAKRDAKYVSDLGLLHSVAETLYSVLGLTSRI